MMLKNRKTREASEETERVNARLRQIGAAKPHVDSDPAVVERRIRNLSFGRSGA
jgi:hypothetical protein